MHTPEQVSENYLALQLGKIERTLLWLESNTPVEPDMDVTDAALAAALSYLDLRWDQPWRDGHPNLAHWLTAFAQRHPWFDQIKPH